ncbi:Glycosyl hydrolase family protein, partial [Thalictrum thalictroides]
DHGGFDHDKNLDAIRVLSSQILRVLIELQLRLMQTTHIQLNLGLMLALTWCLALLVLEVMIPSNYTEFSNILTLQVQDKIIPMSWIDDAVKRILRVKFVMGLFEKPMADTNLVNEIGMI